MKAYLVAALAMTMLLAPAAARADTFTFAAGDATSLQTALDQAAAHVNSAGADVVSIPAGTYSGSFSYAGDAVDIQGAGEKTTTLTTAGITTLEIDAPGSAVSGLGIGNTSGTYGFGLDLVQGGTVHDVELEPSGNNVIGMRSLGDSSLTRARVVVSSTSTGVRVSGGAAATISETRVEGAAGSSKAVVSDGVGSTVKVNRLRSLGVSFPLRALFGGALTVRDSLLVLPAGVFSTALEAGDNNNPSDHTATLDADRVTIVGDPATSQRGAFAFANSAGDDFNVSVHDSVISGVSNPLNCYASAGTGQTTTDWSSLPATGDSSTGAGCTVTRTNAVVGAPIFVDAVGGDYHQRHDSPLIDAGDPAPLAPTEDLDGLPRPVGRVDLGAFEHQTPLSLTETTPTSDTVQHPARDLTPPTVTLMVKPRMSLAKALQRGVRVRMGCSEACGYTATLRLSRRTAKRLPMAGGVTVGERAASLSGAGTRQLTIRFTRRARKALRHRGSVKIRVGAIATDPAGNTGRAHTRAVILRR
jgi:hypothetical protein